MLLSFPFFLKDHKYLNDRRKRSNWLIIISGISLMIIIIFLLVAAFKGYEDHELFFERVNLVYSVTTTFCFGLVFHHLFTNRLTGMMIFSWVLVIIMVISEVSTYLLVTVKGKEYFLKTYWDEILFIASSCGLAFILVSMSFTWLSEISKSIHLNTIYSRSNSFEDGKSIANTTDRELIFLLEKMIKKDKLEEVAEKLNSFLRNKKEQVLYYTTLNILSRLARLNTSRALDEISVQDYSLERNKLTSSILSILKSLEDE